MTTQARIELPPKLIPVFHGKADIRGAYGGRGSGKTRSFATMAAVQAIRWADAGATGLIVCAREFMNSLDESSMAEVKAAIHADPNLARRFDVGEKFIRCIGPKGNRIDFAFIGLRHNLDSIKSRARVLLVWVDEGESVSEAAWRKLEPTIREEGSELWVTWNPEREDSATHKRFRQDAPDGARVVEINWRDNPRFPDRLNRVRLRDKERRPDDYDHVWEGGFRRISSAQIFRNWRVGRVAVRETDIPRFGMDFGFSTDPNAVLKCYVQKDRGIIYLAAEAVKRRVPTTDLPALVSAIPEMPVGMGGVRYPLVCDGARPEHIDHLRTAGFNAVAAKKGPNSILSGIGWLQGFEIIVAPECETARQELRDYAWKVDRLTEEVLNVPVDAHNHVMDALRYATEEDRAMGDVAQDASRVRRLRFG